MKRLAWPLLLFLASFFPLWFAGASLVRAGPAALEAVLSGEPVAVVRIGFGGVEAFTTPDDGMQRGGGRGRRGRVDWLPPLAAGLLLALGLRQPLVGLFAACVGFAAMQNSVLWLLFGGVTRNWMRTASVIVCLGVVVTGLRRMLGAVSAPGRLDRLILLTVGFGLPVVAANAGRVPLAVAAGIAILMGSVRPAGEAMRSAPGWRLVVAAVCVSAVLAGGIYAAQIQKRTAAASDAHAVPAAHTVFFQKGVNLTAEYPDGYDSERIVRLLDELKKFGVAAVALVPYGFSAPGSGTVQFGGGNTMEGDDAIAAVAAQAHQRGMRVFLKPQLWVGRGYPGDLEYPEAGLRARWFGEYGKFVDHYAAQAARIRADLFAVGVEFGKLSQYEREWRELIARARRGYRGPVTYGANFGPEFERIRFWDAVDYIGLNNYYPLPDDLKTDAVVARVEAVERRFGKPVIFAEAGFPSVEGANREPWAEPNRALSLDAQARCYEAVFRAFYGKPWFQGMYWWKVGTNGFGGVRDTSDTPWRKPAMDVVGRWYREGGR